MATETQVDELLDRAIEALDDENPEEALRLVDSLLQKQPDNAAAIVLKAEALVLADRWEEAEETLEEAAHVNAEDPSILLAFTELVVDFHPDDLPAMQQAAELAGRGESLARKAGDSELAKQFLLVQGRAFSASGQLTEAVQSYEKAYQLDKDDDILAELAMAWFEACRFDDARSALEGLVKRRPHDARVHHYLGLIHERAGRNMDAEFEFAKARALDPEEFPVPTTLSEDEFTACVEAAYESLPDKIQLYLANVPVMIDPIPSDDDIKGDPPLSPLSLGMFRGLPLGETSILDPWSLMPSSILLFQRNLERYARTKEELVEEIETTLLHEVGHFVGWDEEDLFERGLE